MNFKHIAISVVIGVAIGLLVGFLTGRKTIEVEKYVQLPPVSGVSIKPIPTKTSIPEVPMLYFFAGDTVFLASDTAAIIKDYITKKEYELTLFDSKELGRLKIFPEVQFNSLSPVRYEFLPIQKTVYKVPVWQPYISAGYGSLNQVSLGLGTFYHNLGFEVSYVKNFKYQESGIEGKVKYKF